MTPFDSYVSDTIWRRGIRTFDGFLDSGIDVVRFINKVHPVYRHLPEQLFGKPPLYAYLCYSEEVDKDASAMAKRNKPSVKLLKIDR
jgi:hypothetical protein